MRMKARPNRKKARSLFDVLQYLRRLEAVNLRIYHDPIATQALELTIIGNASPVLYSIIFPNPFIRNPRI